MSIVFQVFGRVPVAGSVKTRLIPALGSEGAAELQRRMLIRAAHAAAETGFPVEAWLVGEPPPALRAELGSEVALEAQSGSDLGARMAVALEHALERGHTPVLFGTDCPELNAARLSEAARVLERGEDSVVIAPAVDGGYGLIGAREPIRALLGADMPWSTDAVLSATLARAAQAGIAITQLPPLRDVDRPEDLLWLSRNWPELMPEVGPGQK